MRQGSGSDDRLKKRREEQMFHRDIQKLWNLLSMVTEMTTAVVAKQSPPYGFMKRKPVGRICMAA